MNDDLSNIDHERFHKIDTKRLASEDEAAHSQRVVMLYDGCYGGTE